MDDLISRSALLNALENENIRLAFEKTKMFKLIEAAPAVEAVEVKHGRWNHVMLSNYECSLCGCRPYYAGNIHTLLYCPHCGAKMDGEDEGGVLCQIQWAHQT